MDNGTSATILTVLGTIFLCVGVAWFVVARTRKQAYQGTVSNKTTEEREGADDSSYTVYTLVVTTDTGEVKKVTVGRKLWESFQVGDKIIKEAGKFSPTKAA